MAFQPEAGETFTIRRKVLKIFGAAFHIYDAQNQVVGYCKQKAFKLREDMRIFTDESCSKELFRISTKQIIDFGAGYTVTRSHDNQVLGILRRKGLKSMLRDEWHVLDEAGAQIGIIKEDSGILAILRRLDDLGAMLAPQKFNVTAMDGTPVARFRQHFNPFIYRLGVSYAEGGDAKMSRQLVLAAACLVSAIEGRQG